MDKQAVLAFLQGNPHFLAEHAAELGLRLRDDKVRSFAQAQLKVSQQKVDKMAAQLQTMLQAAEANHVTAQRLHRLYQHLLAANTVAQATDGLYRSLREDFAVSQMRLVLVRTPNNKARLPSELLLAAGSPAAKAVAALTTPYSGGKIKPELRALLPEAVEVPESFLQLPIEIGAETGGLLLLADADMHRFGEDLATDWMVQLSAALGVVLSRIMGYR